MASPNDLRFPYRNELERPVTGIEAEFRLWVDGVETTPEEYWKTPRRFVPDAHVSRSTKALQLPTGGALYFDGGVVEVVTPVIEIAPHCTARVVRSLWDQIAFIRERADAWERDHGTTIRFEAFSCHFNISFELSREERGRDRTIQKLALLLAHILPIPVVVTGANRRSTGIGVRPRRDRIEVTLDFTPDAGLMAATAALILGIVRGAMQWPSYRLEELDRRGLPRIDGVLPGRHPSRNGWVTRDFHYPRNPFTTPLDEEAWTVRGVPRSFRSIARETALYFRDTIGELADPFSYRLLFAVLRGESLTLLDLQDRPTEYEDVGRAARWGTVLPELLQYGDLVRGDAAEEDASAAEGPPARRSSDLEERLAPPWSGRAREDVRADDRRESVSRAATPLRRSLYESVFRAVGRGEPLPLEGESWTPVGVRGWYHVIYRNAAGQERELSIDDLVNLRREGGTDLDMEDGEPERRSGPASET